MSDTLRQRFLDELATPMVAEKLFAKVPDIVFCLKDSMGRYVSANPAFAQRLGKESVSEILGHTAEDLFPSHWAEIYQQQDQEVMEGEREMSDRLELIPNRDEGAGWYLASKFPLYGKSGAVIGLASISRDLQMPSTEDLRFAGLVRVVADIQENFSEPLVLADLAKRAELSTTQLERRMRRVFKLTTSQFIRKTRLDAAARMLRETDQAIVDIAFDCGYGDQSAFTRQFKATVGMTPRAYRAAGV